MPHLVNELYSIHTETILTLYCTICSTDILNEIYYTIWAPRYNHGLTLILSWISNHTSNNVWDEITCEAWISNYMPDVTKPLPEPSWLIVSEVLWHSPEGSSTGYNPDISPIDAFQNHAIKITTTSPRDQWVNSNLAKAQLKYNSCLTELVLTSMAKLAIGISEQGPLLLTSYEFNPSIDK